jgi:hypothetical protein
MAIAGETGEQGELPFFDRSLDRYDRLDLLHEVEGFLATSQDELTRATIIEPFIDRPGGAAAHLAEVGAHQRTAGKDDVLAAQRRITRQIVGWASDAHQSGRTLEGLDDALDGTNPHLVLDRVLEPKDARMLPFLRFFDLAMLKQTRRAVGYDPLKVKYVETNAGIMHYVGEAIGHWRVQQVRRRLPNAQAHEAARFDFWTARMREIQRHSPRPLGAIVLAGFDTIYEREQ